MTEARTWRELLGKVIGDMQERQRIAGVLGINPTTLLRWSTGKTKPRQENLIPLVEALPAYRERFTDLIAQEFPTIVFHEPLPVIEDEPLEVPSAFYAHIFQICASTPFPLRTSTIIHLILQQLIHHLDPQQLGFITVLAQCVPPIPGQKVHSLHLTMSQGIAPWSTCLDRYPVLFGAESQLGHALISRHPIIIQTQEDKRRQFPTHQDAYAISCATYPIMVADQAAGSLLVASTQQHYFSRARIDLIQHYTELLTLAFEPQHFYHLRMLELAAMPTPQQQEPFFRCFQRRVADLVLQPSPHGTTLTRPEAEAIAWHELEEQMLKSPLITSSEESKI